MHPRRRRRVPEPFAARRYQPLPSRTRPRPGPTSATARRTEGDFRSSVRRRGRGAVRAAPRRVRPPPKHPARTLARLPGRPLVFLRAEPSLGVDAAHAHVSAASGTVDGALGRRASSRVCDGGVGEFPGAKRGRVGVRGDSAGEPARHLRRRVRDVSRAQRLRRAHRSRRGAFRRRSRRTPRVRPRSSRARFAARVPGAPVSRVSTRG